MILEIGLFSAGVISGLFIEKFNSRAKDLLKLKLASEIVYEYYWELFAILNPPPDEEGYFRSRSKLECGSIITFLETETSFRLPQEGRDAFKGAIGSIESYNEKIIDYKDGKATLKEFVETMQSLMRMLEMQITFITNSYIFFHRFRYKYLGLRPYYDKDNMGFYKKQKNVKVFGTEPLNTY